MEHVQKLAKYSATKLVLNTEQIGWGCSVVVECLLSKQEGLGSIPSATHKTKQNKTKLKNQYLWSIFSDLSKIKSEFSNEKIRKTERNMLKNPNIISKLSQGLREKP